MTTYGGQTNVGELKGVVVKRPQESYVDQRQIAAQWRDLNYLGETDFALVAGQEGEGRSPRQIVVRAAFVFERDDRHGGADSTATLRGCAAGQRERGEENRQGAHGCNFYRTALGPAVTAVTS